VEIMNRSWYSRAVPHWDNYTAKYRRSKEIIATYQPFDGAGEVEYGLALEYMERKEDALVVYTSVLAKDPQDARAMFRKGMLLLDKQDDAGIDLVKAAMEADNSCIESGLEALGKYLQTHNLHEKKEALRGWAVAMAQIADKKRAELEDLHFSDCLVPAQADKDILAKIQGVVGRHRSVKKTYLVRKSMKYSEVKLYVIGIAVQPFCSKKRAQTLLESISEELQGLGIKFLLLSLKGNPVLTKKIASVPDARIG
jgi:tetratricopeptide (TPR) repeat protein